MQPAAELGGKAAAPTQACSRIHNIRMAPAALAGLRALAAARAARPLLAAAAAAAAAARPSPAPALLRQRQHSRTRAAVATGAAQLMQPSTAVVAERKHAHGRPAAAQGGRTAQDRQAGLQRSVRQLLQAGQPALAAHLVQEEWALNSTCLEDATLSRQLILQLISEVNTATALQALPMVHSSAAMLGEAIRLAAQRRSLRGVRALLAHAEEAGLARGTGSGGAMALGSASAGEVDAAARELWRAAIVGFGALRRPDEARRAFVRMRAAGAWDLGDTHTANLLLNALASNVEMVFIRCNQLRQEGLATDVSTFNCLLKACMKARDVRRAQLALSWMERDGVQPDEISYNTLIKVHSYASDFEGVLAVWRRMSASGFAATSKLWGSLLLACSAAGQMEQAAIFWWEMKQLQLQAQGHGQAQMQGQAQGQAQAQRRPQGPQQELEAEQGSAVQQGRGSARSSSRNRGGGRGRGNGARSSGSAKGGGGGSGVITTDNLCAMMTACNDAGQYERALAAFEDGKALGIPLDTRVYNLALRACHTPGKTLRQEQLMQAFALYDELKREGLPPDSFTFGTLFSLCAAARQGPCALQLYSEMRELGVQENVVVMTLLLKAVGSSPGPGMAQECLRIFRRMAHGPARVKPNQATYRTVVAALRESGALAEALAVYHSMRRQHPADNSEFEGLTAVAAERALTCEDAELRRAVAEVCSITNAREVDLHGMSGLEARAAVLCVLALLQEEFRRSGRVPHDVTLITGRGRGSAGGEAVVRREVAALLDRLHLHLPPEALGGDAAPADGGGGGEGGEVGVNPGRIVIPRELIREALCRKVLSRQGGAEAGAGAEAHDAHAGEPGWGDGQGGSHGQDSSGASSNSSAAPGPPV